MKSTRAGIAQVIGFASCLLAAPTSRADSSAEISASATLVDASQDKQENARLELLVASVLERLGHPPVDEPRLQQAIADESAQTDSALTRDPAALDRVRSAAGADLLVRAFAVGATEGGTAAVLLWIDASGVRRVVGTLPDGGADQALQRMLDIARRTPARKISSAPKAADPSPAPAGADRVVLVSGEEVIGRVLEQKPGSYVVVRERSGSKQTLPWSQIARVVVAPRPKSGSGAAGTRTGQATTREAAGDKGSPGDEMIARRESADVDVTSGTASFTQREGCKPGEPEEKCKERLDASVDALDREASLEKKIDCSDGASDSRCEKQIKANVGAGSGVGLSYSKEEVTAVKERPSSSADFGINAGLMGGGSTDSMSSMGMAGFTFDLSLNIITGGKLPGKDGGGWSGFFLEPRVGLQAMSMWFEGGSGSVRGISLGGAVGWQYLSFGTMQEATLEQGGWGFRLGGYVGLQSLTQSFEIDAGFGTMEYEESSENASFGPLIGLSSFDYNPGTASLSRLDINLFVLPTGDFIFGTLGVGYSF